MRDSRQTVQTKRAMFFLYTLLEAAEMKTQDRQNMKDNPTPFFLACLLAAFAFTTCSNASAQARATMSPGTPGVHDLDVGVAGTGQFTTSFSNDVNVTAAGPLHVSTTNSAGALVTVRDEPLRFLDLEVNYQFTRFSERFTNVPGPSTTVFVPTSVHEFTGAYVLSLKRHAIKPYIALGGGYLLFEPSAQFHHQYHTTGLADIGFDVPTHTRIGFRFGARALLYQAPGFDTAALTSARYVITTQPYLGAHYTF